MRVALLKGAAALAITSSFALGSAQAQLDEIVVTAQKKSESLQDVPIAITAFDEAAIEINRIEGLDDIGRFSPGVNVTPSSADQNGVQINIRGIGILDPQIGQDGRVAIYQDGVYIGKTQGLAFDLPDLARVEILKGPQGTLYGRNTVAGAVNLISTAPDPSAGFTGKLTGELGDFNHRKIDGAVNIPLGEHAAARLSAFYLDREGWVENDGPGTDFGGERKYGFRGAIGFEVAPNFRLDLAGDYNKVENESLFYQAFGPAAQPFGSTIEPFDRGRQESVTTDFAPERGDVEIAGLSLTGTWEPAEGHEVKGTLAYREADSSRFVALLPTANTDAVNQVINGFNQALAPLPFAFGVTGQQIRSDFASAFSGTPPHGPERGLFLSPPGGSPNLVGHEQFSAELTYNGEFADGGFEFTGGLFYYDEETGTGPVIQNLRNANDHLFVLGNFSPLITAGIDQGLIANGAPFTFNGFLDTVDLAPGFPGIQALPAASRGPIPVAGVLLGQLANPANAATAQALLGILNPQIASSLAGARQPSSNTLFIDTEAFAVYGQLTWNVTDNFRITGGLRYSDESRDGVGQGFSPFFIDTTDLVGNPILPNISSYDDEVLDPTLIIEYDVNDDILLYGSYTESFRAGGFNAAAVGLRLPGETFSNDFNFDREDIEAYEAGFKARFGDNVLLNGSVFFYDFTDVQVTVATNPLVATSRAIVNTDQETYGIEFDGVIALTENLNLRGSYSYIDGEQDDLVNPVTGVISERDELQGTPENSWLLALEYNGEIDGHEVFGNISYSHTDDILRVPENQTRLTDSDIVNARMGIGFDAGGSEATVSIWVQNVFDDEYTIDALPFNTFARDVKVFGEPRTYGVTLGIDF